MVNYMDLERFQNKRRSADRWSLGIVIAIILVSAVSIVLTIQAFDDFLFSLFAIISLVFGLMALIIGRLLPHKSANVHISGKQMQALATANLLLNKSVVSPSVTKGGPLYRSWNFVGFLIMGTFMGLLNFMGAWVCVVNHAPLAAAADIAACVLWLILIPTSGFWTYYDGCITDLTENKNSCIVGRNALRAMKFGSIAFLLIVGPAFLFAFLGIGQESKRIPTVDADKINQELLDAKAQLDQLTPDDYFPSEEFKNLGAALLAIQQSHDNQKVYYKLQYTPENTLNIISWDDTSEDVFIDCFEILEGDRLKRTKGFLSSTLSKEDVMGKETGMLE